MKLVVTIDVSDHLALAIEDRVCACVRHYADILEGGCRVLHVRRLPDREYELEDRD